MGKLNLDNKELKFHRNKESVVHVTYIERLNIAEQADLDSSASNQERDTKINMISSSMRSYLRAALSRLSVNQSILPDVEYTLLDKDGQVLSKVFVPGNYWKSPHGQACDPLKNKQFIAKQHQPTVIIRKTDITQ